VGESRVLNVLGPKGTPGLGPHEIGAAKTPELTDEQVDNVDAMLAFAKATPT
jgi:hypothetical protein